MSQLSKIILGIFVLFIFMLGFGLKEHKRMNALQESVSKTTTSTQKKTNKMLQINDIVDRFWGYKLEMEGTEGLGTIRVTLFLYGDGMFNRVKANALTGKIEHKGTWKQGNSDQILLDFSNHPDYVNQIEIIKILPKSIYNVTQNYEYTYLGRVEEDGFEERLNKFNSN